MKEQFKTYLREKGYKEYTPSGNPGTVYDYMKRIDFVCEEEGLRWQQLADESDRIVPLYDTTGAKADMGNKSHRSVINALKRFQEFVIDTKRIRKIPPN